MIITIHAKLNPAGTCLKPKRGLNFEAPTPSSTLFSQNRRGPTKKERQYITHITPSNLLGRIYEHQKITPPPPGRGANIFCVQLLLAGRLPAVSRSCCSRLATAAPGTGGLGFHHHPRARERAINGAEITPTPHSAHRRADRSRAIPQPTDKSYKRRPA